MMTPRSRKPVVAVSASNICHLANLTWGVKESCSWDNINSSLGIESFAMAGSYSSDSLAGVFKDYLSSRSVLTASPVDLSFSSRTGDFDPSSENRIEELDSSSEIGNIPKSPLSDSLLYILDGNLPDDLPSDSPRFGDSRPKKRDAESSDDKPNKRFVPSDESCESSGIEIGTSREVHETSL